MLLGVQDTTWTRGSADACSVSLFHLAEIGQATGTLNLCRKAWNQKLLGCARGVARVNVMSEPSPMP